MTAVPPVLLYRKQRKTVSEMNSISVVGNAVQVCRLERGAGRRDVWWRLD